MQVDTFLEEVNDALRSTDDDTPAVGSDEANYWLRTARRLRRNLYNNAKIQWKSRYKETPPNEPGTVATAATTTLTGTDTKFNDYRAGDKILVAGETVRTIDAIASDTSLTVTVAFSNTASGKTFTRQTIIGSGVESYSLHRNLILPSSTCYVVDADDHYTYFDIIHPNARKTSNQQVFISDENPQVLTFTNEVESTYDYVGGTLYLPGYYLPDDFSAASDLIDVDDPDWLVVATAAKIAFGDLTYEDKFADLNAEANALYAQMTHKNRKGTFNNPTKSTYNTQRISGF